jgi:hypothetical protein
MVSEKLLDCLRDAGADGLSSTELAVALYGERGYTAQGRVAMLIGNLRKKGFVIHTVILFDGKVRTGKYVLVSTWSKN